MNNDDVLVPPSNFSLVCKGIYRGSYPNFRNFSFLKSIGLKSILYLCPEDYSALNIEFLNSNGIKLLRAPMDGNKEPFKFIPKDRMIEAMRYLADKRNYPIYIHCNKGKHRTGSVVGCLRKMQMWTLTSIFEEYRRFAWPKVRPSDEQYIEFFHCPYDRLDINFLPEWLSFLSDDANDDI